MGITIGNIGITEKKMEAIWTIGIIYGLYRDYRVLRLYGDNGKENGNYHSIMGYIGIWVAVKELKLNFHNGYIYIYSK